MVNGGKYTIHGSYEDNLSFPEVNVSNAPMSFNQVDHIPHLSDTFSSHLNPEETGWFQLDGSSATWKSRHFGAILPMTRNFMVAITCTTNSHRQSGFSIRIFAGCTWIKRNDSPILKYQTCLMIGRTPSETYTEVLWPRSHLPWRSCDLNELELISIKWKNQPLYLMFGVLFLFRHFIRLELTAKLVKG